MYGVYTDKRVYRICVWGLDLHPLRKDLSGDPLVRGSFKVAISPSPQALAFYRVAVQELK